MIWLLVVPVVLFLGVLVYMIKIDMEGDIPHA